MEHDSLPEQNILLSAAELSPHEYNRMLSARLRALEEATSDLCWVTTNGGHFLAGEESWEKFTGQSSVQAEGKGWLEAIHLSDRRRLEIAHAQCAQTKQPCDIVCLVSSVRGRYKRLSTRCIPVLDDAGCVQEILHLGALLSPGRPRADKWLTQAELEHLEAMLVNMAHDAIVICEPTSGRILSLNQGATDLYGYSEEEAVGKIASKLFKTRYPLSKEIFLSTLLRDGKWEGELRQICRDGRQITVESRVVLMRSENKRPLALLEVSRDITERKRTEQLQQEYIQLAETAGEIGLWTWDLTQNKSALSVPNRTFLPSYQNYEPHVPTSYEQFLQIVHPDDRETTEQAVREALEQKSSYVNEFRVIGPDQTVNWYMACGRVTCDEQGKPARMIGIILNISGRKRIEQELQEANERVIAIIESIDDSFIYLNKEWRYIYVNSRTCQLVEKSRDELLGQVIWEIHPDLRNTIVEQKFRETMKKRQRITFDVFSAQTGRWFSVRTYPAKEGITVFTSDITERKQIEEALRKSEAKLRRLVEANVSGVAVGDSQGHIIEANDAYLKILECTREELEHGDLNWYDFTPPEYHQLDQHILQELRETGVCHPYEKEYISRQGKRVPVLLAGATIEAGENVEKHIVFAVDLTKQKELEKQREHFLRLVSHELRTPLTAVNGSIQLAQRRLQKARKKVAAQMVVNEEIFDKVEEVLLQSLRQTHVLNRLIDDLAESARITAEKLSLSLEPYNLVEIVRATVEDMRFTVPEREIILEDMPPEIIVKVDAGRINQVLANLIANALKYSLSDKPVEVGITLDEQEVSVWVRDQGPGLSPEEQHNIWQRYFQGQGVQDHEVKSVNLGLGLHLCRLLVLQHKGRVGVKSQLGEGSTFWFTLPLYRDNME
jgi:PAS domain S-box-containing protein